MKSEDSKVNDLIREMSNEFTFDIRFKTDSKFWRSIPNKNVITATYNTIWFPKHTLNYTSFELYSILLHERTHFRQFRRLGLGNIKLGFYIFLILYFLLPLPSVLSYFRARFEKEAYKETIRAYVLFRGPFNNTNLSQYKLLKDFIVDKFLGKTYGYMWPFRRRVESWFDKTYLEILIEEDILDERA